MKSPIIQYSLRWKLLSVMIGLMILVVSVSTYIQIRSQEKIFNRELALNTSLIKEKLTAKGKVLSENLTKQVQNNLATVNLSKISEVLHQSVKENDELAYALLIDSSDRVYIHTLKPELELERVSDLQGLLPNKDEELYVEHSAFGIPVLEFIMPIQISTKPWGMLRLGFSLTALNQEIANLKNNNLTQIKIMIQQSLFIALVFIIIAVSIILMLLNRLFLPLSRLTVLTNKLASGDFSAGKNIKIHSNDEVGVLGAAFVNMSNELQSTYLELQKNNRTLESKVKQRTSELATARDEAIRANQSKSDFLSMVSHEIRTPMNAIINLTKLSLKSDLNAQVHENLSKVKLSADSLLLIINDILDSSKIEAGQMNIENVPFKLDEILSYIQSLLKTEALNKQLELSISKSDQIPDNIIGDPTRLSQVLLNLISNAIKFTEKGSVIVSVKLDPQSNENLTVIQFSVKDTGIGLTEKQIAGLFQPFFQADISTSRIYGGTGLGLYISRQLVELMGGHINVQSVTGVGSEFTFTIACQVRLPSDPEQKLVSDHGNLENTALNKRDNQDISVLVVDDYLINQEVAKALLEEEGFHVQIADSGEQAILNIQQHKPDVVLMDLQMPVMDGFETTQRIFADSNNRNIPIIGLTAHTEEDKKTKCLESGMIDCISKPIEMDRLLNILSIVVKNEDNNIKDVDKPLKKIELSGLNFDHGLNKVSGDTQFYCQILTEFERQFSNFFSTIREHVNNDEKEQAVHLIHDLKGVAGNIAAESLAAQTKSLEDALLQNKSNYLQQLDLCEEVMHLVITDIQNITSHYQNKETSNIETTPDQNLASIELSLLIELIKLNRFDVIICFEKFKQYAGSSFYADHIELLERYINELDFKAALAVCGAIKQNFSINHEVNETIPAFDDKPKILIVDNSPINIKILANTLIQQYHILIAKNAEQALSIATSESKPDMILMGVEIPEINGYELCRNLKNNESSKMIPVIFITGHSETEDETSAFEYGAVDFIAKPFVSSIVLARVNSHIKTKKKNDLLEQLASLDGLTSVPNRRMFEEQMDSIWADASKSKSIISIVFIDVDFFKNFNDFYGHSVGDQCLCIIAKTLAKTLKRKKDFLARYGGEEFVAILPETNKLSVLGSAELMRQNIENLKLPHIPNEVFTSVTISLGVASVIPDANISSNDLIRAADEALYEAKFKGRNKVVEGTVSIRGIKSQPL